MEKREKISQYGMMINKIMNGKNVKYYNATTFYLSVGADQYELTPTIETPMSYKKAHFISANIKGKNLIFPNPLLFKDGSIQPEHLNNLKIEEAFEMTDKFGAITGIQGAEIAECIDKYGEKYIGIVNKGKIELNGKKYETSPGIQEIEEEKIEQKIENNEKIDENTDIKTLIKIIERLEEKVKNQQYTINNLEILLSQQQKITYSNQQQFTEIIRIFKELLEEIKKIKNTTKEESILNQYDRDGKKLIK